jgi:hypothetical protein
VAANVGGEIFRWSAEQGFVDLGAGYFLNSSVGISADGSTIAATIVGRRFDHPRPMLAEATADEPESCQGLRDGRQLGQRL